jgi:O-antigen/teichoic acid export membrane protein
MTRPTRDPADAGVVAVEAPTEPSPPFGDVDILDTGAAGGRAIRGGVLRTLAYGGALGLSLVSVPFMIRHLGAVQYGYFITVSSIMFIIGGVTEAGLTNLGVREFSVLGRQERESFLRNLVGLRYVLTTLGVAVAVLVTGLTQSHSQIWQGCTIAGAGLLAGITQQSFMIPLSAQLRLGWVSGLELLRQTAMTVMIVALVLAGAGLLPFFGASVVGPLVVLAVALVVIRRYVLLRPSFHVGVWKRILRETLPYAAASAVGLIYFRLAVILMSYIASGEETGYYSAAFRIVEVIGVIPWLVVSSALPILARAATTDEDRLGYALQRLFDVSVLVGAGIALAIGVGAPFAIDVVAGPGFGPSIPVLRLQGLAVVTSFLVATWAFGLLSLKMYRQLLVSNAIAAAVAAAGTFALVPVSGARGAAIATLASEAALALAYVVALVRAQPRLRPSLSTVWRVLPAAALGVAVALLVPGPAIALAILSSLVFAGAAYALGAVPPELINALLRREPEPSGG